MEFDHIAQLGKRKKADLLVLPFWKEKRGVVAALDLDPELLKLAAAPIAEKDFQGQEGELTILYMGASHDKRVALLGLGAKDKLTVEGLRRCFGALAKKCLAMKIKSLNLALPHQETLEEEGLVRGIAEGLLLPNYVFNRYKQVDLKEGECLLEKVTWIGLQKDAVKIAEKAAAITDGVYYARDLVNSNADDVTPQYLVKCAHGLAKEQHAIKTTILDKKRIEKEKLGLLLAVNRGSACDPAVIIMEYHGNPRSNDRTVIIGKGITYDTGGLNLKGAGMETMKCDMSGAAACFGTILAVSQLKLKVNLTVLVLTTENAIDARSFKPGDVYRSYAGTTVEIINTDAEGRLILADGLAYAAKKCKPTRLIDIATLTGAIDVALGPEASGLMSTDDALAEALQKAGEATYERVWRMPLFEEYKDRLKSDVGDLKNWNGRAAASNVAATFLRHFVREGLPWAHIDIASTAYVIEAKKYQPKYATGVGVRLFVEFLEGLEAGQLRKKAAK